MTKTNFKSGTVWSRDERLDMPLVVSFYTDDFYLREAYGLVRSCQSFGVPYFVQAVDCQGNGKKAKEKWLANTNHKPSFLQSLHHLFPERDLLWIDADGRVRRSIERLSGLREFVIGYHTWRGFRPASGTVLLPANPMREEFLDAWVDQVERCPTDTDQLCMQRTERKMGLVHLELPSEFCWIYDLDGLDVDSTPVIEHMQASRFMVKGRVTA